MRDRMRKEESTRRWRRQILDKTLRDKVDDDDDDDVFNNGCDDFNDSERGSLKRKRCDVEDENDDDDDGGDDNSTKTTSAATDNGAYPSRVIRRARRGRSRRPRMEKGLGGGGGGGGGGEPGGGETYESLGEGRNFFVLAADGVEERFVYTIFPASGCVVATGLRRFPRFLPSSCARMLCPLPDVLKTFCNLTGVRPENIWDVRVTNSTWSGSLRPNGEEDKEALGSVMEMLSRYSRFMSQGREEEESVSIDFRSQFFPGARLQRAGVTGVINLFNNGSFVIVGVRNETQAERLLNWLAAITNMFWKSTPKGKSYVWTVGSCWKLCLAWEAMKL